MKNNADEKLSMQNRLGCTLSSATASALHTKMIPISLVSAILCNILAF